MTPMEYTQLRAFSRVDGVRMAVVWTASFACYVASLTSPIMGFFAMMIALVTPFLMSRCTARYARIATGGRISMRRAYFYGMMMFFYASLLFAFVQWIYFGYLDNGTMLNSLEQALSTPEGKQALEMYGMQGQMSEAMQMLRAMRPIDIALNILTTNLMLGLIISLISALITQLKKRTQKE